MERIKTATVEFLIERINNKLKSKNKSIALGGRNGYKAIDLYNLEGSCLDTLTTGNLRTVYIYLQGMDSKAFF